MAMVTQLLKDDRSLKGRHPTEVECRYMIREFDGKSVIQLNTYGSDERQIPDKLSQTLQFDDQSARQLLKILKDHFGD